MRELTRNPTICEVCGAWAKDIFDVREENNVYICEGCRELVKSHRLMKLLEK